MSDGTPTQRDERIAFCNETARHLERIRVLEAALAFYEDPFTWSKQHEPDMRIPDFYSEMDFGERARAALTDSKGNAPYAKSDRKQGFFNMTARCALCGEPMPAGEEMFNYHGFSGPCPKPPLKNEATAECSGANDKAATEFRTMIAREIWAYNECPWDFDAPPEGMAQLQKQLAVDQAERIRAKLFGSELMRSHVNGSR